MRDPDPWRRFRYPLLAVAVLLGGSALAHAEAPSPDQIPRRPGVARPRTDPDFWFGRPRGSVGVHGSWLFAREGSDLFDFFQDEFTIEAGDFSTPTIGFDVGFPLTPRVDAVFGLDFSQARKVSEYRNLVDNNRLPIVQETSLREANVGGSVRVALSPRGREVSRRAWIPHTVTPYVGGGGGMLWYRLRQDGDFVDIVDFSVFGSRFESQGWTPSAHVFGGVDVRMWRRLFLMLEGRYLWAHADLERDYFGFEPIDLAGFKLAAGINVVF